MKAKDLAALAALGVAGYAAYDKFGKKEAPVKKKMGEGLDMTNQGAYERATRPESSQMDETDYDAPRTAPRTVPEDYDAPRTAPRQPVAVASPVPTRSVKPVSTSSVATTPDVVADDYQMPRTAPKPVMPDASRVTPYNPDIMYADTVKSDPNAAHDDEMNRLARTRATRQGAIVAQSPNAQAQARILRQGPTPAQSATNAQAQARMLRQGTPSAQIAAPVVPAAQTGRYTKDQYGNIIDNSTGKVSRTIFSAGQEGNAARNGMKRGGAVKKMASGGLASSKPSSASSRGDGIAQRGKTRGTMR